MLQQSSSPALTAGQYRQLQAAARAAKEQLSDTLEVDVDLQGVLPAGGTLRITREIFEGLIQPLVKRTLRACRKCLRDAELDPRGTPRERHAERMRNATRANRPE